MVCFVFNTVDCLELLGCSYVVSITYSLGLQRRGLRETSMEIVHCSLGQRYQKSQIRYQPNLPHCYDPSWSTASRSIGREMTLSVTLRICIVKSLAKSEWQDEDPVHCSHNVGTLNRVCGNTNMKTRVGRAVPSTRPAGTASPSLAKVEITA